jgi:hypothetical protein
VSSTIDIRSEQYGHAKKYSIRPRISDYPVRYGCIAAAGYFRPAGNTKHLIWRGRVEGVLSSKPEKHEKKLDESMGDMFKEFPPKEKG